MYGARRWHLSTDGGVFVDAEEIPGEGVVFCPVGRRPPQEGRKTKKAVLFQNCLSSDPPGDRTLDPNIKSVVLYQLS